MAGPRVAIGRVASAHGVAGQMKVSLYDAGSTSLSRARVVFLGEAEHAVTEARRIGGRTPMMLLRLRDVTTREAAAALRGVEVAVDRADVDVGEGEYLVGDLEGCQVFDRSGRLFGEVQSIFHSGAHEVLVLDREDRMVPLVPEWVLEVDLEARRLVIDPHE